MASQYDWETIRAEYEAGASQSSLSQKHGVSRTAIQKHISKEGWVQGDVNATINRMAEAKVAGVVAGCNLEKKAEALAVAAEAKAAIMQKQRQQWIDHQKIVDAALAECDFEQAKLAKITAETLAIRQKAERAAWGLDKAESTVDAKIEIVWQE